MSRGCRYVLFVAFMLLLGGGCGSDQTIEIPKEQSPLVPVQDASNFTAPGTSETK